MAAEAKRGCGYRKIGGLYLVDDGAGAACCKMPLALTICPCCGAGIKQTRGWTWVDAAKMFPSGGCVGDAVTKTLCPAVNPAGFGRVGLVWIGESFYPRPIDFLQEAAAIGISRRLPAVPRDYEPGKTWVLFAHPKAIQTPRLVVDIPGGYAVALPNGEVVEGESFVSANYPDARRSARDRAAAIDFAEPLFGAGVIRIARPKGFEKIVKQSDYDAARADISARDAAKGRGEDYELHEQGASYERDAARGVKWVPVPDDDPDHQGSVYDKRKEEEEV